VSTGWSGSITWGSRRFRGGIITSDANAWSTAVIWGATRTGTGKDVEWGVICPAGTCGASSGTWARWDVNDEGRNVVWGNKCGGANCSGTWSLAAVNSGDVVVWGTGGGDGDIVVWGTSDGDIVVWGTGGGDVVVWGTSCSDSSCEPVIWNR
jgi:hypothetical protein